MIKLKLRIKVCLQEDSSPEGPEVKLIGENLAKMVCTRKLIGVMPLSGRYIKQPIDGLIDMQPRLPASVIGIGVKGKLIFWILDNDHFLLNTLAMTGTWASHHSLYARVRFDFDNGSPVYFVDTHNFGSLKFIYGRNHFKRKLDQLGPDMLSEQITCSQFVERLDTKSHWPVCKALMDQSVVSGVGNYVKAETLYRAKISPHRTVGSLSGAEMSDLMREIQAVLKESYEVLAAQQENRTDDDSRETTPDRFMVYGKKTDSLGNEVVREMTPDGRRTHWVPAIQV